MLPGNRKAPGRRQLGCDDSGSTHTMIQELQSPKVSNAAFLGVCPFSSPHQTTPAIWVAACLWVARGTAIGKSCKPTAESWARSWGAHIIYNSPVAAHTHTELSQACYMLQHTEHCLWNGLGSWYIFSSVHQIRNLQSTYLSSIQPDKWQQKLPLSGFIFPPYSCCAARLGISLSLAGSSSFSEPQAIHYL